MATIYISEADLARDPRGVLAQVRAGAEVIIEENHRPVAVIRAPARSGRRISEILADVTPRPAVTLDADFGEDLSAVIARHREPWTPPSWE